jgi:hypothetical protein
MPPFPLFQLVSLLLALVSVRVLVDALRAWRRLFDQTVTPRDRQQLAEVSFFLLVPIGVLLHELGHVVAIWQAGGQVVGFGFLFFMGWVEHTGDYTAGQLYWIALSGNLVNVLLGLAALLIALSGRFGYAVNWLLLVFGGMELATALVFYPMLDIASGLHGDWSTLYRSGGPSGMAATATVHASVLLLGVLTWRSAWFRRLVEARTGFQWPSRLSFGQRRLLMLNLSEAAEQVASGWRRPVEVVTGVGRGDASVVLRWESGGIRRQIETVMLPERGVVELQAEFVDPDAPGFRLRQRLGSIDRPLPADALAELLARLMTDVDRWPALFEPASDG